MGNSNFKQKFNEWSTYLGFKSQDYRILLLGLDSVGKTSILYWMKVGEHLPTIPTIGFNVETVKFKNINFTLWDVGGREKMRVLIRHYYSNTKALVYIVDSCDRERISLTKDELKSFFLDEDELRELPLLIFANKQDLENHMTVEEIQNLMQVDKIRDRPVKVVSSVAITGEGLTEGFDWLITNCKNINQSWGNYLFNFI